MTNPAKVPTRAGTPPVWLYLLVVAGVLSFASSAIMIRYAGAAPGLAVAVLRTSFAVVILAPAGVPVTMRAWRPIGWRDVGLVAVAGALLGLHFVSWIASVYLTSIANAAVLVSTGPVFLALMGFVFLGERLERRVTMSIVIAVAGSIVLALGSSGPETGPSPMTGNGLALLAALLWAVYLLIGRIVRQRMAWLPYTFPLYVVAGLTTLAAALWGGVPLTGYPPVVYGLCALMAIFPQILGHGSFNYAVRFFPAAVLGLLGLMEPVGATILAWMLFGEVPGGISVAGMILILAGVAITVVRRPKTGPPTTD